MAARSRGHAGRPPQACLLEGLGDGGARSLTAVDADNQVERLLRHMLGLSHDDDRAVGLCTDRRHHRTRAEELLRPAQPTRAEDHHPGLLRVAAERRGGNPVEQVRHHLKLPVPSPCPCGSGGERLISSPPQLDVVRGGIGVACVVQRRHGQQQPKGKVPAVGLVGGPGKCGAGLVLRIDAEDHLAALCEGCHCSSRRFLLSRGMSSTGHSAWCRTACVTRPSVGPKASGGRRPPMTSRSA